MDRICAVPECGLRPHARGLCRSHYGAWWTRSRRPAQPKPTLAERFWAKVDKRGPDECWLWTGSLNTHGYGQFGYHWRTDPCALAHRVAYELTHGHRPDLLRHRCDNPPCVNPRHLEPGTVRDNIDDMVSRGRSTRGEKNPQARLTAADVRAIRDRHSSGVSAYRIAKDTGMSQRQVGDIIRRRAWGHVA